MAHLPVNGCDPRRILLMTFSRRGATELTRRVERITAQAMGTAVAAEALTRAGTFQSIRARILREHGPAQLSRWSLLLSFEAYLDKRPPHMAADLSAVSGASAIPGGGAKPMLPPSGPADRVPLSLRPPSTPG